MDDVVQIKSLLSLHSNIGFFPFNILLGRYAPVSFEITSSLFRW